MTPEPTTTEAPKTRTPAEFLATIPGAPTPAQISEWKAQVPGGRIQVFSPDGKRVYLVRGFSGLEMENTQKKIPQNSQNPEYDYQLALCALCTLWTNTTSDNKLDQLSLRAAGAGLHRSMFVLISQLSDFFDPEVLEALAGDL